jgi:hypothetical protein
VKPCETSRQGTDTNSPCCSLGLHEREGTSSNSQVLVESVGGQSKHPTAAANAEFAAEWVAVGSHSCRKPPCCSLGLHGGERTESNMCKQSGER